MEASVQATQSDRTVVKQSTAVALFEDAIDAEQALVALRKANQSASHVSLLIRNRHDERNPGDGAVDVARDIVAVALGAVANWLTGLAELIVSERGRYVVAGPMGAALSGFGRAQAGAANDADPAILTPTDLNADSLQWVLTEFGLAVKEATYVEHRLSAGATLIAITTADSEELETTRHVFGDHDAVYIGVAATNAGVLEATGAMLAAVPELAEGGDVVVVDVVARVRPALDDDEFGARRGAEVICLGEVEAGQIDRVLVEDIDQTAPGIDDTVAATPAPRYVVIGFGGMLGIGRRKVAVPTELVDLTADPVVVRVDKAALHRAPVYDEDAPLSRSVEEQIFRYFDVTPYWSEAGAADAALATSRGEGHGRDRQRS